MDEGVVDRLRALGMYSDVRTIILASQAEEVSR
jgi:hypothetical protein